MTNLLLPLRDIDEGGEDEGADAKEHEDKAQLLVGSPHGVAQPLQALGRGGTNSSIFLNIGDTFDPQVFLGVVLCIKNEIIF